MNSLQKLFEMQRELDNRIKAEHSLHGESLFEKKVLALLVELGELANETRCFKFWSKKPASSEEVVLEEYVDGVHFILSLGIELGIENKVEVQQVEKTATLVEQFNVIFSQIDVFRKEKSVESYQQLMNAYFTLADILGFSFTKIEKAYYAKNEVNHERQDTGY